MRNILRGVLLRGVPVSVLLMLGTALLLTVPDVSAGVYRVCAGLPLLCGGFASGWYAGRRNRRHGLRDGLPAGCLLTAVWYASVRLSGMHPGFPVLMPAVCLFAMCGGAAGVNRKAPEPRQAPHGCIRMREGLRLWIAMLRKPKNPQKTAGNMQNPIGGRGIRRTRTVHEKHSHPVP